ncbi:MAG: prepilin-type N-terminal cleavage/methylation domain-containing protein [Candidatus Omnitrophica bacterium]|nr:prepilin-type N-terminal cleavage/methylation domain-containing protein [Candidatus Omnitrophota bacterium]
MKRIKTGFTLIELMIVVLIIALLASIAIPNILRARVNAHDAAAQAALKTISTALETYLSANNAYPSNTTSLLSATPPYLQVDYFTGTHNGFTFTVDSLSSQLYSITAAPASANLGSGSFTITTGSILTAN